MVPFIGVRLWQSNTFCEAAKAADSVLGVGFPGSEAHHRNSLSEADVAYPNLKPTELIASSRQTRPDQLDLCIGRN